MNETDGALRERQMESLSILLEFRRVCEGQGLRYYLTAGTLLGAVRHRGFIPWDDDIDVAMPREDYDRLRELPSGAFGQGLFYQSSETEKNYPGYFAKLRKRGTYAEEPLMRSIGIEQGLFIDIFPLDRCPDGDRAATLFFKGMELIYCAVMGRVCPEFVCGYRKKYMRFLWSALRRAPNGALFGLREGLRKLAGGPLFAAGTRLCTVGGRHGFPQESFQSAWFDDAVELEFEGHHFPAPAGWDGLLKNMYGDYMVLPPAEERQGHFMEQETGKERER